MPRMIIGNFLPMILFRCRHSFHIQERTFNAILTIACLAFLSTGCAPLLPANPPVVNAQITLTPGSNSPEFPPAIVAPSQESYPSKPPLRVIQSSTLPLDAQNTQDADSLNESQAPTPTKTRTPQLTSDLLFLSQGILMRWDHVTDYIGTLAENVTDYTVSANGKAIAMLRTRNVTANGVEQYKLDLLDFETKQITTFLDQTPFLYHLAISPDARWIMFSYDQNPGEILVLQTGRTIDPSVSNQPDLSPIEMGRCDARGESTCQGMAWSPDSQELLWGDSHGIWISTLGTRVARLVQTNIVTISDPQNETNEIEVTFPSLDWSPAGRFALLTIIPTSSQVSWQAILDTRTGRLVQVPDSYEIDAWESNVTWADNGDLIVLHSSDLDNHRPPFVNIYGVNATSNELLVPLRDFDIQGIPLPVKLSSKGSSQVLYLDWPNLLDPRTLILGSAPTGSPINPALLSVDLLFKKFEKLLDLPAETTDILWSPDGQNALILGSDGQIKFLTLPGGPMRDIRSILSENAHDFFWLPPTPRF